jgi:MOSC domain-containing protein YiiM
VGEVLAVCSSPTSTFGKQPRASICLLAGLGVEGDAHLGRTVKHRSRVLSDPTQPNLRRVHLVHSELFDELRAAGFDVTAGQMGENITTRGLDLLALPASTLLHLGADAVVEVTGLRNPCHQLDAFRRGLMAAVLDGDDARRLVRKAGVMSVVRTGGVVRPGDSILAELPPEPHQVLDRV